MKIKHLLQHITLFVVVEFLFVLLIFREVPSINVISITGIGHILYRLLVLCLGWLHDRVQEVWQKFLLTFMPIVAHVAVHILVTIGAFHEYHEYHSEYSITRMVIAAIVAGIVIFAGEYLLHRKTHCDTHHQSAHKKCQTSGHGQCEHSH